MANLSYADILNSGPDDYHTVTVTSQAEANALNAQGAQQVGHSPAADGKSDGTYIMRVKGKDPALVQQQLAQLAAQQAELGKAAQEKQYADMLDTVDSLGSTGREIIKRNYADLGAQTNQNLISRGLTNSTIAANAQRGVMQDQTFAQNALEQQLQQQRLGVISQQNITYPSLDQIGALALQAAQNKQAGYVPLQPYVSPPAAVAKTGGNKKANYAIPGIG